MRLIDVDSLADALFYKHKIYPQWVADTIGGMPVVDAVPVVRCKDCKYCTIAADKKWRQDFGKSIYECDHKGLCYVEPDWFCADGERNEME